MKQFAILFFCSLLIACSNLDEGHYTIEESNPIEAANNPEINFDFSQYTWLSGSFRDTTQNKVENHEKWSISKDSIFGKDFYVDKISKDTFAVNTSTIKIENNAVYYINQGKENKVKFKLQNFNSDSLHFTNPAHRYPQDITYKRVTNDQYLIKFSGFVHQENRRYFITMNRYE